MAWGWKNTKILETLEVQLPSRLVMSTEKGKKEAHQFFSGALLISNGMTSCNLGKNKYLRASQRLQRLACKFFPNGTPNRSSIFTGQVAMKRFMYMLKTSTHVRRIYIHRSIYNIHAWSLFSGDGETRRKLYYYGNASQQAMKFNGYKLFRQTFKTLSQMQNSMRR